MKNVLADGRWTQREVVCGCRWASTTARLCRSGVKGEGGCMASTALVPPPTIPIPYTRPGVRYTYVVCGCCWASTTARANVLTQIVPNLSSLYTLFYFVIYNSVVAYLIQFFLNVFMWRFRLFLRQGKFLDMIS